MKIYRESTAKVRNELGEVVAKAKFAKEPTILLNRGKEAAAIVPIEFLKAAMESLGLKESDSE